MTARYGPTPVGHPPRVLAAVLGGAVTKERLQEAAARAAKDGSPLVQSLLAQSLPTREELARAYGPSGLLRLDPSFLRLSPSATRLIEPTLLRQERCVPIEILDDLCVLAVTGPRAAEAVQAVREALGREVLPVLAEPEAIDLVLAALQPSPAALHEGPLPRRDSPVHARFREIVIEGRAFDPLPMTTDRVKTGTTATRSPA